MDLPIKYIKYINKYLYLYLGSSSRVATANWKSLGRTLILVGLTIDMVTLAESRIRLKTVHRSILRGEEGGGVFCCGRLPANDDNDKGVTYLKEFFFLVLIFFFLLLNFKVSIANMLTFEVGWLKNALSIKPTFLYI